MVLDQRPEVRAVIRTNRNMASLCRFGPAIDIKLADAENVSALTRAFEGVNTVVNLVTGPPATIVRSTRALVEACSGARVQRFIHLSSAVVYGDVLRQPVNDDDAPVARHWMPYARAKAASELWLRSRVGECDVEIVVLRPGVVWGVRSPHTVDIARRLAAKSAFLVNEGHGIFNGIFINNLTSCIRACCDHDGPAGGFYNVGDDETVTWRDLYNALGPALDCDATKLPIINGQRFPHSIGSTLDAVQSWPPVNAVYHRAKVYVPDDWKAAIRSRLEGDYQYERPAPIYASRPSIDREMWHLQQVKHKLPTRRFAETFAFKTPVPFRKGICRTLAWLDSLGFVSASFRVVLD
jgi:nucleoside-diphosphate-sugar epimerase